jgi:hypothetical protein
VVAGGCTGHLAADGGTVPGHRPTTNFCATWQRCPRIGYLPFWAAQRSGSSSGEINLIRWLAASRAGAAAAGDGQWIEWLDRQSGHAPED